MPVPEPMTLGNPIKSTKAEGKRGWFPQRRIKMLVVSRGKTYWVRKTREVPVKGIKQVESWKSQGLNPNVPNSKRLTTRPLVRLSAEIPRR